MKVSSSILNVMPYQPGKPISEAKRELGLTKIYKLASNENPWGPSPQVFAALQKEFAEINRYPDPTAYELLKTYSDLVGVLKENVTIGDGSSELIDLLIRLYCEPGDGILTSEVAFIAYKIGAHCSRVRPVETPLTADGKFNLSAMAQVLEKDTSIRLVFIANPNNPTGTYLNGSELEEFLQFCSTKDVLVILDEAYAEFARARDYVSGLTLRQKFPHLVILRTMSKAYGLASLRVGLAVGHKEEISMLNRLRNPFSVSGLAQAAAVAALKDQDYLKKICSWTWAELDKWNSALTRMDLNFYPSQGNFLLVDCKRKAELLFQALLKRGIIARTVTNYGLMNHLRFSVGLAEENDLGVRALQEALKEVPIAQS